MSMEMRVFFRGDVPDTAALTQAFKELDFRSPSSHPTIRSRDTAASCRCCCEEQESGAEFYLDDGRDQIEEMVVPERLEDIDPSFDRSISFRFGGDWNELVCATCAVAALAKLLNGVVYEEQDGVLWPVDQAIKEARNLLDEAEGSVDGQVRQKEQVAAATISKVFGAPEGIRTPDPQIRSLVLYPAELPAQCGWTVSCPLFASTARGWLSGVSV